MRYKDRTGREVDIIETEFEPGEGVYVIEAVYLDSGENVSEETIEYLTDTYQSKLYESAYESRMSEAYDMYKDFYKYGE